MARLFVLIRKKGSKRYLGAIPARTGSATKLRRDIRKSIKPGFSFRIVTLKQLKSVIVNQRPRVVKKKRSVKRKKSVKKRRKKRK